MTGVQFHFRQLLPSSSSYDVWSIDNFAIVSVEQDTKCSMACYSDNFNSGFYNSEFWSSVVIASVMIPPCSLYNYGKSLYFTASGTREAITNSLDLRGLYAITFTLQIGSYDNKCDRAEVGDDVILYYLLLGSSNWVELRSFDATAYIAATTVTVPIPRQARLQGVKLRWAQPQHSGSLQDTWFIDNVGVYSPNQCPPIAYSNPTTNPLIIPNLTSTLTTCSYYSDNFDGGTYKTELWSTAIGVRVSATPCSLPPKQHYAMEFYSNSPRQLITQALDLRGLESFSFYLLSSSISSGSECNASTVGMYVGYRLPHSTTWHALEYYTPSCCKNGTVMTIYLPGVARVNSIQLRWWQISYPSFTDWILDDVQIGGVIDTILYEDSFTNNINPDIWSSVSGGYALIPPCGITDTGSALHFSGNGIREAVTSSLDMRQATNVSFFLQIGSTDSSCENADREEDIEFSYKVLNSGWTLLQTFASTSYRTGRYVYINVPNNIKVNGVQFRIAQVILASESYDVWSIDTFTVHSIIQKPECTVAC